VAMEQAPASEPAPTEPVTAQPAPAPGAVRAPDLDEEYIAGLTDEQRDELAEAEFAEKRFGEKYKGQKKKLLEFYRSVDKQAKEKNGQIDEADEEWQKLLRTKPSLTAVDQRRVIRAMGAEEARTEIESRYGTRFEDLEREQKLIKAAAHVNQIVDEFGAQLHELVAKEPALADAAKVIAEKGIEEAIKTHPLEAKIIVRQNMKSKQLAETYTLFANKLIKFDPKNDDHIWLNDFVTRQCDVFKRTGGAKLVKDGKKFLTRAEYLETHRTDPKGTDQKFWTFDHEQILDLIALNAKRSTIEAVKEAEKLAKEYGLERRPKASPTEPPPSGEEPQPLDPPKAGVRPAPGAAQPAKKPDANANGIDVVSTLRMKS